MCLLVGIQVDGLLQAGAESAADGRRGLPCAIAAVASTHQVYEGALAARDAERLRHLSPRSRRGAHKGVWAIRDAFYESLGEGKLGMFGALVARGEARGIR